MKKILIIGKRSFIAKNLYKNLNKKFRSKLIKFNQLNSIKKNINNFNYVINCSISKNYIKKKYNKNFDNDFKIATLINNTKTKYIFLSSRKVYKSKPNIKENSKLLPKSSYSRNKLITEKKLLKKFKKNLIILRISNIIGNKSNKKNHLHRTFVDIFFDNAKKGFVLENKKQFKDFISIDKFCQIIVEIIQKNLSGIYNVSIGQKIKINSIIAWLNFYNPKKCKILSTKKNIIKQNFYLNNKKLMSKIKTKNTKNDLKKYCLKLSKEKFA